MTRREQIKIALDRHNNHFPDNLFIKCMVQGKLIAKTNFEVTIFKHNPQTYKSRYNISNGKEWLSLYLGSKLLSLSPNDLDPQIEIKAIPNSNEFSHCTLTQTWDDRFKSPPMPYFEDFRFNKSEKKRIVFMGGSTAVDNGGEAHFPYLLYQLYESIYPNQIDMVNLSSWGMSLLDHRFNIFKIQQNTFNYPFFSNHVYRNFYTGNERPGESGYSLPQLAPDLIILSAMWNDFAIPKFVNKKMLPTYKNIPLSYIYSVNLVNQSLNFPPLEIDLKESAKILNLKHWRKNGPIDLASFEDVLYKHYYESLKLYIQDVRNFLPNTPILLLTLPFGIYEEQKDKEKIVERTKEISLRFFIKDKKSFINFWPLIDKIQIKASQEIADPKNKIFLFDLSSLFRSHIGKVDMQTYFNLNIHSYDLMHFTDLGNNYVANFLLDEVYKIMNDPHAL